MSLSKMREPNSSKIQNKFLQTAKGVAAKVNRPKDQLTMKQFKFIKQLQSGGSGQIYLAEFLPKNKQVAVKVVPLLDFETTKRFSFECIFSTKLNSSDHIINTYGYFVHNRKGFLVLDIMEGDLLDSINSYQTPNSIKKLFQNICQGVSTCHRHKIAHLDIKPENILLDVKGKPFLGDFGAAYYFNATITKTCGTLLYNAPETRKSLSFDKAAADIWSLGVLLHILITGVFPFPGETDTEVMDNLENGNLDFSDFHLSSCTSSEAEDLVHMLLAIDPECRPTISQVLKHPYFA